MRLLHSKQTVTKTGLTLQSQRLKGHEEVGEEVAAQIS